MAKGTGIFGVAASAIELPPPLSTGEKQLASWTPDEVDGVDVQLLADAAVVPEGGRLRLDPAGSPAQWTVAIEAGEAKSLTPLARLALARDGLNFQWSVEAKNLPYRALRNCLLKLTRQDQTKHLALRTAVEIPAPVLGFDKKVESLSIDIADPPAASKLYLMVVDDLSQWPARVHFERGESYAAVGKPVSILMDDLDGAAIEVKLVSRGSEGVSVTIAPKFRENAALEYDLTLTRLEVLREATQKSLQAAQLEGPQRVFELKALQTQLAGVLSAPASTPLLVLKKKEAVDTLNSRIQAAARKIETLQKKIPEYQARLAALPTLETAVKALAGQTRLRFRVVAALESQEIVLINATQ